MENKFDRSTLTSDDLRILEDFHYRRMLLDNFISQSAIKLFTCPGCGYPTLTERDGYEICSVCNWEDDGQDDKEADEIWGGPNHQLSLTENRVRIGKQLKVIAESLDGEINADPKRILNTLAAHDKIIADIINNMHEGATLNHPLLNEYNNNAGQQLLKRLITK